MVRSILVCLVVLGYAGYTLNFFGQPFGGWALALVFAGFVIGVGFGLAWRDELPWRRDAAQRDDLRDQ